MRFNKIILALLVSLTIVSCRKDDVSDPVTTPTVGPFDIVNTYTVDVQGIVKDPEGRVIPDAIVNVDGQEVMSSENGVFLIQRLEAPETGLYINADAEGYFEGGVSIYAFENQTYSVNITLIPFDNFVEFDTGAGLDFVSTDGTKVSIPADGIVDEQGNPYNGMVDFYTYWIDPTDENLAALSPGSLVGQQEGELFSLRSYGMIAVEMTGDAGQDLNLADGANADLSFPVPSSILSSASSEIDLWHFNESNGRWDHEGQASLVNGAYEATVSHFSWWNCDIPSNLGFFCFNIMDSFDDPVGNVTLNIFADGFGYASANVGPSGLYCNLVPLNQNMEVTLTTHCGDVIWSGTVLAVEDGEEVDIVVPLGSGEIEDVNISGTLDCGSNGPVTNGYVVLSIGSQIYLDYVDDQGNYSLDIINCLGQDYDAMITGYNLDELLGGTDDIVVGTQDLTIDIDACEDDLSQENFMINYDGEEAILFDCKANISVAEITIVAKDPTGASSDYVVLGIDGFGQGTFGANVFASVSGTVTEFSNNQSEATVTIGTYGDQPGDQIAGTVTFNDLTGTFVATVQ